MQISARLRRNNVPDHVITCVLGNPALRRRGSAAQSVSVSVSVSEASTPSPSDGQ